MEEHVLKYEPEANVMIALRLAICPSVRACSRSEDEASPEARGLGAEISASAEPSNSAATVTLEWLARSGYKKAFQRAGVAARMLAALGHRVHMLLRSSSDSNWLLDTVDTHGAASTSFCSMRCQEFEKSAVAFDAEAGVCAIDPCTGNGSPVGHSHYWPQKRLEYRDRHIL